MRMQLLGTSVALLSLLPTHLFADTREERLAVAEGYVEATLRDLDMKSIIEGMWKPLAEQIQSGGTDLSEDQLAQIDALYQGEFTEPMNEIMREQAGVMADIYTLDEITALAEFYATEHGRAAIVKMPKLLERQTPMIMEIMQAKFPQIMPKIKAIVDGG